MKSPATEIHPTAVVDPKAQLGLGVKIGPYTVIHGDVQIGDLTEIGPHVVVDRWTTIGRENRIFSGAIIGSQSQDLKYKGARTHCVIGDRNTIREYVTINRATIPDARTIIGNDNSILAYCHVAHDCELGSQITISNVTTLAGHVRVSDQAGLGGYVGVHQFCRIGRLAFVGGWSKVVKDVPPFVRVSGAPLGVFGLNVVGLERRGIPVASRKLLRKAYSILYRSSYNVSQAIELIKTTLDASDCPELQLLLEFVATSERGIVKHLDEAQTDDLGPDPAGNE